MKLSVEQILNLQEMKVLNSDEIEGLGLVIEIQIVEVSIDPIKKITKIYEYN